MLVKVTKFPRVSSKALTVMTKKIEGPPKETPGLNRVKKQEEPTICYTAKYDE